jgi:hypothetical protein
VTHRYFNVSPPLLPQQNGKNALKPWKKQNLLGFGSLATEISAQTILLKYMRLHIPDAL